MGPPAIAGAVMFILSIFAMNCWRLVDGLDSQLLAWRGGLFVDTILYAVVMLTVFRSDGLRPAAIAGIAVSGLLLFMSMTTAEAQIWEVLQIVVIAIMASLCFLAVRYDDLIGRLMWGILMIGEIVAIAQTADCQLLHGMFGTRAEGSACEQVYGADLSLVPLGMIVLFWTYLLWRWYAPRK